MKKEVVFRDLLISKTWLGNYEGFQFRVFQEGKQNLGLKG